MTEHEIDTDMKLEMLLAGEVDCGESLLRFLVFIKFSLPPNP